MSRDTMPDAIEHLSRAAEIQPENPTIHHKLGIALRESGNLSAATGQHRLEVSLAPESAEARNRLGIVLGSQGLYDEAEVEFHRALTLRPDFPEARRNLDLTAARRRAAGRP